MPHFGDYQLEVYFGGLQGVMPKYPVDFAGLEARAQAAMPPSTLKYVQGGCGDEHTQRSNADAFRHWGLVPRMMVDCSTRDLSIDLFGMKLPTPLFMAPIGVTGLCTQDGHGDLAAAGAAAATGVPLTVSTLTNDPLEDIAAAMGDTPGLFQLYTPKDPSWPPAWSAARKPPATRRSSSRWTPGSPAGGRVTSTTPTSRNCGATCCPTTSRTRASAPCWARPRKRGGDIRAAVMTWAGTFGKVLTWADMPWLRSPTKLPIILKGICHPDDARRAIDEGADGIYCSNHGGRQANGGIAAIDMLPAVVEASGKTPVLFDSGVRSGSDVAKALALGATAVGVGRPYVYGLALGGAEGAAHVLKSLLAEADLLMAVDGFPDIAALRAAGAVR